MSALILPTKLANEIVQLPPTGADFTARLQQGEVLTGTPAVTISVYSGLDPSPQSMLSGAATLSGNAVLQKFAGGVPGCIYRIVYASATSLGQLLEQTAYLVVLSEAGAPSGTLQYILLPDGQAILLPSGQGITAPT